MHMRGWAKKGASASGTAVFLGVMALVIIIYIIALPPDARDELLGDNPGAVLNDPYTGPGGGSVPKIRALLFETDGIHVDFLDKPEIKHSFNVFNLMTKTEAAVIASLPSMRLESSSFAPSEHEEIFSVNPDESGQLLLSFNAASFNGRLMIMLNGATIYDGEIDGMSPEPIRLPKQVLLRGENVLTFKAPAHGLAFWSPNKFMLSNIQVSGVLDDRTRSAYEEHFTITRNEYSLLETADVSFLLNCNSQMTSPLEVAVNGNIVYSTVPLDCGRFLKLDVNPSLLREGDNLISFRSIGSNYLVEQSYLMSHLRELPKTLFYYTVPTDVFEAIYMSGSDTFVRLTFTDDLHLKRGVLLVNGFPQTFETDNIILELPISTRIIDGTNSIKIEPLDRSIDIQKLEVFTG